MQLKLDVKKLNNEDVISTSILCSYEDYSKRGWARCVDATHFKFDGSNPVEITTISEVYDKDGTLLGDANKLVAGAHYHFNNGSYTKAYLCEDEEHEMGFVSEYGG